MIKMGEFHWTQGWFFSRLEDGAVRVEKRDGETIEASATIPPAEWASIVAHVAGGEPGNYVAAVRLHSGGFDATPRP